MISENWFSNFKIKFCIFAISLLTGGIVFAAAELVVSTAGLGDARYRMDVDSVERAIGRPLLLDKGKSKAQVQRLQCSYARIADLPEVVLRFEMGRFAAVDANKPNVATRFGVRVGDPEKVVIDRFQRDPNYFRTGNQYDDSVKEITLGKVTYVGQGPMSKASGFLLKITSKKGRIIHLQAGQADYVTLVEHDEDCGE